MNDLLETFDWGSLYGRYDALCVGFDSQSPHLSRYGTDRPRSDRELYYRLIDGYAVSRRTTDSDPLGSYEALLYWKLYSQPWIQLTRWMAAGEDRRSGELLLPRLLTGLPATLDRSVDAVVEQVEGIGNFELIGMRTKTAIVVRTAFLHFMYPSTVPIFDTQVLKAVGINLEEAKDDYSVLREYLPLAWQLADRYADRARMVHQEQPLRLIDMAHWVNRVE